MTSEIVEQQNGIYQNRKKNDSNLLISRLQGKIVLEK